MASFQYLRRTPTAVYIIRVFGCLFESLQPVKDKFIAYTNTTCCQVTRVFGPWKRDGCKTLLVVLQPCGFMFGFPLHPTNTFPELFLLHPPIQIVVAELQSRGFSKRHIDLLLHKARARAALAFVHATVGTH